MIGVIKICAAEMHRIQTSSVGFVYVGYMHWSEISVCAYTASEKGEFLLF